MPLSGSSHLQAHTYIQYRTGSFFGTPHTLNNPASPLLGALAGKPARKWGEQTTVYCMYRHAESHHRQRPAKRKQGRIRRVHTHPHTATHPERARGLVPARTRPRLPNLRVGRHVSVSMPGAYLSVCVPTVQLLSRVITVCLVYQNSDVCVHHAALLLLASVGRMVPVMAGTHTQAAKRNVASHGVVEAVISATLSKY